MTAVELDTIVLGGGVMGSSTAWQLARRGRRVLLLERFEPGHAQGASHGAARNFNTSYYEPDYARMIVESRRLWGELEAETGTTLLDLVGLVRHGADRRYPAVIEALRAGGETAVMVSPDEADERWPQLRFDTEVLWCESAGRVRADDSVAAMQVAARMHGADVRHGARVTEIAVLADDRVRVTVESASGVEELTARSLVVTAGAWTSRLLSTLLPLPTLRVTQEQPAHFAPRDPESAWPTFMHTLDLSNPAHSYWLSGIYGMLTPGEGVKAGWHGTGPVTDPDHRSFQPVPAQLDALRRYASEWLPGVDADRAEPISCTYTSTRDENFILDRVGPITIGAGFSGQGFKFAPVVGRILSDLVMSGAPAPEVFRLPAGTRLYEG